MATVYQCPIRELRPQTSACREMNQGKRAKCGGCGSSIRTVVGHAIVARHRGDGRYTLADAVKEYATLVASQKAAQRAYEVDNGSQLVARFILA